MFHKIACLFIVFMVLAGGFLFHGGCQPLQTEDPIKEHCKLYGKISGSAFPYKWYDYYEGALSFAEGGCWEQAEVYLKEAIRQRGEDQWNARTYGRHFIDYFPNREMGIAYYYLAQKEKKEEGYKAAVEKLEESLSQTPSAKAIYYLEIVYNDWIALDGKQKKLLPEIHVQPFWTKDEPVVLSGTVADKKYIRKIAVNITNKDVQSDKKLEDESFEPVFILNSLEDFKRNLDEKQLKLLEEQKTLTDLTTNVSFKKQFLFLPQGEYVATIRAENIMGGVNDHKVDIRVDRLGPMITIADKKYTDSDKALTITGFLGDESGISSLFMNNQQVPVKADNSFEAKAKADEKEVGLVAMDQLGNQTAITIDSSYSAVENKYKWFANAGLIDENNLIACDGDSQQPIIKMYLKGDDKSKSELESGKEIYTNLFTISVEIESNSKIDSLMINDDDILAKEEFFHLKGMISSNKRATLAFDYAVDLQKHTEYIVKVNNSEVKKVKITATDDEKNEDKEKVIIIKKKGYNATDIKNRLSILVFPFSKNSDQVRISPQVFHEKLVKALGTISIYTDYPKAAPGNLPLRFQIIPKTDMKENFLNIVINPNSDADKAMEMGRNENEAEINLIKNVLNSGVSGWEDGVRFVVIGEIRQGYISYERWDIKRKPAILIKADIYETEKQKDERIQQLPIRIDSYVEIDVDNTSINDKILEKMSILLAGKFGTEFPLLVGDIKKIKVDGKERKTVVTTLSDPKLRINTKLIPHDKQSGTKIGDGKIILPTNESEAEISKINASIKNITKNKVITE